MVWHAIRPLFSYFANIYSRQLSDKIKAGIRNKKDKGIYRGGRPKKEFDMERLKIVAGSGVSFREISRRYNEGLEGEAMISHTQVGKLLT